MASNTTPKERFERWYVASIQKLKELPTGDGAFAALMIALPLYDRYIRATLILNGKEATEAATKCAMAADLGITEPQQAKFWAIYRNGFTHQAMGLVKEGGALWAVSSAYGSEPEFAVYDGIEHVLLDPWKFADRVLYLYNAWPETITASKTFEFADIFSWKEKQD